MSLRSMGKETCSSWRDAKVLLSYRDAKTLEMLAEGTGEYPEIGLQPRSPQLKPPLAEINPGAL